MHVLVNNASPHIESQPFLESSRVEMERYIHAYVRSCHALAQGLVPAMKERGHGRIVNILTSYVVGVPPTSMVAYVTAKSALWGMTKALAVELAPHGVTVNAISPAAVLTDQWEGAPESRRRALAMRNPMRGLASPEDVAEAVVYLAGGPGRFVTGQNLLLAGGEAMP